LTQRSASDLNKLKPSPPKHIKYVDRANKPITFNDKESSNSFLPGPIERILERLVRFDQGGSIYRPGSLPQKGIRSTLNRNAHNILHNQHTHETPNRINNWPDFGPIVIEPSFHKFLHGSIIRNSPSIRMKDVVNTNTF
jgi:hypothetical protein